MADRIAARFKGATPDTLILGCRRVRRRGLPGLRKERRCCRRAGR